jgi:autotransporter-associated beta strand protein
MLLRILRCARFALGIALIAFMAHGPGATGQTWDGGGLDDNWSTAANWSPDGAPANDGTAGIVFAGSVRLTPYVDTAWDVLSLTFNNTAGSFFIYGSPLTVGAGGIVNQNSAQSLENDLLLSAPQTWQAAAGNLRLLGNVANSGHLLTVDGYHTTAVYGNITGSGGLVKSGTGTLELRGIGPTWYAGPTTVNAGTLSLLGISTWTAPFTVNTGATVAFNGGVHEFNAGATVSGGGGASFTAGMVTFNDTFNVSGPKTFSGGTVNFNGPVSGLGSTLALSVGGVNFNSSPMTFTTLNLSGGALGGSAKITVTDRLNWASGTMSGTGPTEIPVGGSLALSGTSVMYLARTVKNSGAATLSYYLYSTTGGSGAVFNNLPGATFDVQADYGLAGTAPAVFNNAGTFRKSAGTGTTDITSAWTFNNTGTFEVQTGTVSAAGPFNNSGIVNVWPWMTLTLSGSDTSSGTFTVGGGGTLQFTGGTHTLNGALDGPGRVSVTGGSVTFNGPVAGLGPALALGSGLAVSLNSNPVVFATIDLSGGTLAGSARVTVTDRLNWTSGTMAGTGPTEIPAGGSLAISGSSAKYLARTVNNSGIATLAGTNLSSTTGAAPVFNNLAGATFDVQADYGLAGTEAATFNNAGTFRKSAGTGTTTITSAWTFNNTGTFVVQSGTVSAAGPFNNSGLVNVAAGRTLTLSGGGASSGAFVLGSGATLQLTGGEHAFNPGATVTGAGSVTVSGGTWTGGGAVTVEALSWTGGTMTGTGTTVVPADGTLAISGSSAKSLGRTITSGGMVTFTPSTNLVSAASGSGAVINNLPGGMFDVQADYGLAGTEAATFNNAGTFRKSAGTGTTTIGIAWTFNNTGTFEVQRGTVSAAGPFNNSGLVNVGLGGTLTLSDGGTSSGPFSLGSGAVLQFSGGEHVLNTGATITGAGRVTVTAGSVTLNDLCTLTGDLTLSGGTAFVNAPSGLGGMSVRLSGGTLAGAAPWVSNSLISGYGTVAGTGGFTNYSLVSVTGGNLVLSNSGDNRNVGTVSLAAGLQLVLSGGPLSNTGTINLGGGLVGGTSALSNNIGGNITGSGVILAPFSNAGGTLCCSGGTLNVAQPFSNAGLIRIDAGSGLAGADLINTGIIQGDGSVANAMVNQGQIECTSGTLLVDGVVTNRASGAISAATGGKVVVAAASPDNQGMISLDGGEIRFSEALVNAKSGRIAGRGRFLFSGGLTSSGQMQFAGGLADVFGAIDLVGGATGGKIINSGVDNLVTFYNDVTHNGAEVRTSAGNTTVFFGDVRGAGSFTGPGTVVFEGSYSPGASPAAVGFEGDAALGSAASLLMELAGRERGAQYDALLVSGRLALDGALDVTLLGGYEPRVGDSFDLLDWGTLSGGFSAVNLPALAPDLKWSTDALYTDGTLRVVPEPGALALAALGGLLALRPRRPAH